MRKFDSGPVNKLLSEAMGQGLFPGAALSVWHRRKIVFRRYAGKRTFVPWSGKIGAHSVFDLASLTKPLVTALACMLLKERGRIGLADPVSTFFKDGARDMEEVTLQHLLCHSSGLPAHNRLYENRYLASLSPGPERIDGACDFILSLSPRYVAGTSSIYSDLGYILLGRIVEKITGMGLFELVKDEIFLPCGLDGLYWQDSPDLSRQAVVPTGYCALRQRILMGEVHDANSWFLRGTPGHAGLFGTLEAVEQVLFLLTGAYLGLETSLPLSQGTIRAFWQRPRPGQATTWRLGFDSPSASDSTAGSFFSSNSIGHLGYTGTSFWIDLDADVGVIFLSNRTFPFDSPESRREMKAFRQRLHNMVRCCLHMGKAKGVST